jgi:tetratricopeptide (TPR) repeat protein
VPSLERLNGLAARAPERERLMIRAAVARSMGDPGQAAFADSLAGRYPAEPEGHLGLGIARIQDGDFLGAIPHLFRVIAADSLGLRGTPSRCHACGAYALVMSAYTLADSIDAAERVVREWMRRQPGAPEAWRWLGAILAARGHYQEAGAALRTAAAASRPDVPMVAAFHPATVSILAGDFAAADRYLMQLAQDSVPDVRREALWYLTISLRHQGRLRDALQAIDEYESMYARADAVERFPSALHRAQILFELERFREAAHTFDSLAAFSVESFTRGRLARHKSWTLTHLAASHAAVGDTVALTALIEPLRAWGARSAYGRDRRLHHHANALLLTARGHDEQAAVEFRRAIYSPGYGYTRTNYELGRILLRLGRTREAIAVLVPALRGSLDGSNLYITRTELHALLGDAYHAAGSRDSATVHWQRALAAWENADAGFDARRAAIRTRLAPLE